MSTPAEPVRAALPWPALVRRLWGVAVRSNPGMAPIALWRVVKLFAHELSWWRELRGWHDDAANPALREMVAFRPGMVCAVIRPYVNVAWPAPQRLAAIREHYRLVSADLGLLRVPLQGRVALASLPIDAGPIDICVDAPEWFAPEGELAINLFHGERRLYSLAFSLGTRRGEHVAYIGALQGLRGDSTRDTYRVLTRELHGLRPRELLIAAFRTLCVEAGVTRILAVSDRNSVCRSSYFGDSKKVLTSYDAAWRDHDGVPDDQGFFELPVTAPRRTPEAVPARKRAEYRRRYDMLDRVEADIAASLHGARKNALTDLHGRAHLVGGTPGAVNVRTPSRHEQPV